ncbi:MAG: MBL fold metallo-hydrolase, partial [Selenomonadaceae bacterium]
MLKFSYYGHSAFLLDDGSSRLLFDPFLTFNPSATLSADKAEADYILVSHGHQDH